MSRGVPLDGVKIFLSIRDAVAGGDTTTSSSSPYHIAGPRRARGTANAVRRRTRQLVSQLGGTLCLSEPLADLVLCYNATPSFMQSAASSSANRLLDPAYVEACVEANARVDPAPFVVTLRSHQPDNNDNNNNNTRVAANLNTTPPLTPPPKPRGSLKRTTPVKHVSQAAFAFDLEATPVSATKGMRTARRASTTTTTASTPTPALTTSPAASATPPLAASFTALTGAPSTSTSTLTPVTQASGSTPPYSPAAPLPPSMEELRHSVLRASAQKDINTEREKRRARSAKAGADSDSAQAHSDDVALRPTRRSRPDPFLLTVEELQGGPAAVAAGAGVGVTGLGHNSASTLRSRTPTPRVTQRLASHVSCSPAPPPTDQNAMRPPVTCASTAPAALPVEDAEQQSRKQRTVARARKLTAKTSTALLKKAKTGKSMKTSTTVAPEPEPEPEPAPVRSPVMAPALPLPPDLHPMPLYDSTGHYHPRKALRIGIVPDTNVADTSLSLWSDVIEQLGGRYVDLAAPSSESESGGHHRGFAASRRRSGYPNLLIAPSTCDLTLDVLIAKAHGIPILLPLWIQDAILLGDFPAVLPERHAHPLFGDGACTAPGLVSSLRLGMAAGDEPRQEGSTPRGDQDVNNNTHSANNDADLDLLGVPSSAQLAQGDVEAALVAAPSPPPQSRRRPRSNTEVAFLQRTTAEEYLPVGEHWERPFFTPIFRDMMFYLRSAEDIESSLGTAAQATKATRRASATHDAVVTLEHVTHIIRTLGGTVTRNLDSVHLDVVLDLVVDFGQLAAEVGLQAVAAASIAGQAHPGQREPRSSSPSSSPSKSVSAPAEVAAAMASMPVPCASLSLVYQHAMTCMESYSQLAMMQTVADAAAGMAGVDETDADVAAPHLRTHASKRARDAGESASDERHSAPPPPLRVVGLPWLVYSVLTRQCANLAAFVSARPPPAVVAPRTSAKRKKAKNEKKTEPSQQQQQEKKDTVHESLSAVEPPGELPVSPPVPVEAIVEASTPPARRSADQ